MGWTLPQAWLQREADIVGIGGSGDSAAVSVSRSPRVAFGIAIIGGKNWPNSWIGGPARSAPPDNGHRSSKVARASPTQAFIAK
jgi:hypothetical protein